MRLRATWLDESPFAQRWLYNSYFEWIGIESFRTGTIICEIKQPTYKRATILEAARSMEEIKASNAAEASWRSPRSVWWQYLVYSGHREAAAAALKLSK